MIGKRSTVFDDAINFCFKTSSKDDKAKSNDFTSGKGKEIAEVDDEAKINGFASDKRREIVVKDDKIRTNSFVLDKGSEITVDDDEARSNCFDSGKAREIAVLVLVREVVMSNLKIISDISDLAKNERKEIMIVGENECLEIIEYIANDIFGERNDEWKISDETCD